MNIKELAPRILLVDDEPINVRVLVDLLRPSYELIVAKNGVRALECLQAGPPPDLALLDVVMPEMDGLELCRRMKADPRTAEIPIIFISALGQVHDEMLGFDVGGVDYITKPISPPIVLARVRTHLALRKARQELARQNCTLEDVIAARTRELGLTQDVTIRALASLAETRDNETGAHLKRTQYYVKRLAEELRNHPPFAAALTGRAIELMFKSAPLHDVGKVGIPDAILLKPGKLTEAEFEIMKTHTALGRDALMRALDHEKPTEFLRYALDICSSHHEKWDGTGYPEGLKGEDIPLAARLMALADVYDALTSRRVYKAAFDHARARQIIEDGSGRHFDPAVVAAFRLCTEDFQQIARTYADED
ncbi:MAG: two-component system response regulator [Beijerinckiaceae bacterium]|nr:two-component system response regulator [Beijerinckiaceae bacterium]